VGGGEPDLRAVSERIDGLLAEFSALGDARVSEQAQDLVRLLMQMYGAGLSRVVTTVGQGDPALLERLADDELVSSLLVLHDLHPLDVETRVERALDRVRPYLGSHGGEVKMLGVEGDVCRVRMGGSCEGCPSSAITLVHAIEKAILDAAPEVSRVEAVDVQEGPASGSLIQLQPRRSAAPASLASGGDWLDVDPGVDLTGVGPTPTTLGGMPIVLCRAEDQLYAYRDVCPSCAAPLRDGLLADRMLACRACGHRFDVHLAGRSAEGMSLHLQPLPLLSAEGSVRICVPLAGP